MKNYDYVLRVNSSVKHSQIMDILVKRCNFVLRGNEGCIFEVIPKPLEFPYLIVFLNDMTFDMLHDRESSRVHRSGRKIIELNMPLDNFPDRGDDWRSNRDVIWTRFDMEFRDQYNSNGTRIVRAEEPKIRGSHAANYIVVDDLDDFKVSKNNTQNGSVISLDNDLLSIGQAEDVYKNKPTKIYNSASMLLTV